MRKPKSEEDFGIGLYLKNRKFLIVLQYHTILFDFDGVLCRDRFYTHTLIPEHQFIVDWIQKHIFGDAELCARWMRGEIDSRGINNTIATACGVESDWLHTQFLESVRKMKLDERVVSLVKKLKMRGVKVGLVTNNMDVFSEITITNHKLSELFEVIINSSDYGILKKDNHGELFDVALEKLAVGINKSLMIDDSTGVIELYRQKGGSGFLYTPSVPFGGELQKFLLP